jgi:16S rRNA (cytidine1402-2'-O)-methyltransferase
MPDDAQDPIAPGLYLVATPIGNLGDITLRALDILRRVDLIACEDTRQTQKLLNHFEIATPTVSCHEHNEHRRAEELLASLKTGARIALVSDAGMPGISDPGTWLATEAIAAGLAVIPDSRSQCRPERAGRFRPAHRRISLHWLSSRKGRSAANTVGRVGCILQRRCWLHADFYEAPHRILDTLEDLESVWGPEVRVVVARELTKIHEDFCARRLLRRAGNWRRAIAFEAKSRCSSLRRARAKRSRALRPPFHKRSPSGLHRSRPNPVSTRRKHSSDWPANWANPRAMSIGNCSASGRG